MNKFTLDESSFKALSSESRVNILKSLLERRKTLSELGKRLDLKNSTIKEHCEILMDAALIDKIDEGRKWKYYELTKKGKHLIEPNLFEEVKIFVTLCFTAVLFAGILLFAFQNIIYQTQITQSNEIDVMKTFVEGDIDGGLGILEIEQNNIPPEKEMFGVMINMEYNTFSILIVTVLIIGIFIGWLSGKI